MICILFHSTDPLRDRFTFANIISSPFCFDVIVKTTQVELLGSTHSSFYNPEGTVGRRWRLTTRHVGSGQVWIRTKKNNRPSANADCTT